MESLIKLEAERMKADVIVAGGLNDPYHTCPFPYRYVSTYEDLVALLRNYEKVLYHWPTHWAVLAIGDSGLPSVEFVHRIDTSDCDKQVPDVIVSHSQYVCDYIQQKYDRICQLVPNVVDTDLYTPSKQEKPKEIGAVTSYYETKGIDILIHAWKLVQNDFPDYSFVLYGAGARREDYEKMARDEAVRIQFYGPVECSKTVYDRIRLVVTASRVEGLPIALLEALSCNLPVLASDIEGHRIINTLCQEQNIPAPLHLFKSEDVQALANGICSEISAIESGETVNTRQVALNVFSPGQHIKGLEQALIMASEYKGTPMGTTLELMTEISKVQAEIFSVTTGSCSVYVWNNCISNTEYFVSHSQAIYGANRVTVKAEIGLTDCTNIYYQIDFMSRNSKILKTNFSGIFLDPHVKQMSAAFSVPSGSEKICFSIRPNPGEILTISSVDIHWYRIK